MKNNLVRPLMAALFLISIALGSCKKQDNGVGVGLFGRDNNLEIEYVDTFNVVSTPIFDNIVQSSGYTDVLLGSINDPFFGKTKTSFYTQFLISGNGETFSDSAVCDSIVFYAKLGVSNGSTFYGPENKEMTFNVYRINSDASFHQDSVYYTNSSVEIINESVLDPSFENTFKANFDDTIQVGLDTLDQYIGVMKLKLNPQFGQDIINLSGTEVLSNNEEFTKIYKGLYITTDGDQDGTILNIDYSHAATSMVMYMHKDTAVYDYRFIIDANSNAHFNEFKHDYDGTASSEYFEILNDSSKAAEKYFIQTGSGYAVNISMPTLSNVDSLLGVLPINKAELIMPIDPNYTDGYEPGNQLFITMLNEDGYYETIEDVGSFNLGGLYDEYRSEYRFIITEHIQQYLSGIISSPDVRIEINKPGTSPNRVIFTGNKADTSNGVKTLKLRLYYSTLNE